MHCRSFIRLRAEQQGRREERARGLQIRFAAQTDLAACGDQVIHFLLHVRALFGVDQRAHLYPFLRRVAHRHLFQAGNQRLAHGVNLALRDDNAADGRTFLPGFGGHLAHHFPNEQGKFRLLRRDVFPQHAAVQGVGFHRERNGIRHNIPVHAQALPGAGGAGKGDHVLAVELVEQIPRTAADQADGTVRHQPAVDDRFHHRLRHLRGGGGRFDDGGHARKPGRGQFFQHSPAGEVKGVDVHRHAGLRGQDVTRGKAAFFRQRDRLVFRPHGVIRQLAAAQAGISEEGADPAFDIDPAV